MIRLKAAALIPLVSVLALTSACGAESDHRQNRGDGVAADADAQAQQADANATNDKGMLTVEEVVQRFQIIDQLPLEPATEQELADRKNSLIPLEQLSEGSDPLVVEDDGLGLDDQTREVVDLRANDIGIRNQGSEGLCTAFATISTLENLGKRYYGVSLDLSERQHWRSYQVYQTPPSLSAAKETGIVDEAMWPYNGNRQAPDLSRYTRAKLSDVSRIQGSFSQVVDALRAGNPVVLNLDVNGSFMRPQAGGIIRPGGTKQGGHAIAIVGSILDQNVGGGGYWIIKNSWGASWGDRGYGYVPFNYCQYSYCYAWTVSDLTVFDDNGQPLDRLSDTDPTPAPTPDATPSSVPTSAPTSAPTSVPTAAPTATPTPVVDVTATDFQINAYIRPFSGIFSRSFYLSISGRQAALNQIKSVEYHAVDDAGYVVVNRTPAGTNVDRGNLVSRTYRTSESGWTTDAAIVTLKDGRMLEIPGARVSY